VVSASGVLKVLGRHGLGTRIQRLALVAGYAAKPLREAPPPIEPLHLEAERPGDLVQIDCFYIGRLSGTRDRSWQYSAIDVASSYVWADVHLSKVNPDTKHCSALVRRVADELAAADWKLKTITTDNGGEFRAQPLPSSPIQRDQLSRPARTFDRWVLPRSMIQLTATILWCTVTKH
jgi:hypothetical protein